MRRILVVDDEPKILRLIRELLEESGHSVETCASVGQARELLEGEIFDLLITDVRLPDESGVVLLERARDISPSTQVILITAFGSIPEAVRAMKLGATDYIQKPFEMEALRLLVERTLERGRLREDIRLLRASVDAARGGRSLVFRSTAMRVVQDLIEKVAPTSTTVLISGESGTGKELVAETIHRSSPVRDRPLVKVSCLAIPAELMESELFGHVRGAFTGAIESRKGWFELASGGTLFLDEVADMPLSLQGKLLRVLEERCISRVGSTKSTPVAVRVLAATNRSMPELVARGLFRKDLYYRLNVFPIAVPPLRDRREDIPGLVEALLATIATRLGRRSPPRMEPEVLEALAACPWPGNVRELRNVLERAAILAGEGTIALHHLPVEIVERSEAAAGTGGGFLEQVEACKRRLLLESLQATGWVKKAAAERLGLSPRALSHYIGKYSLDRETAPR